MITNKTFNTIFLIITGLLIPIASLALIVSIVLHASYHYKDFYVTPSLRYFHVYIASAILIFGYAIYLRCKSKLRNSSWMLIALCASYPAYFLSAQYKVDIPRTVYYENVRYDIPWEFQPSGTGKGFIFDGFNSNEPSLVSFSTSYPEFSLPIKRENRKEIDGYDVFFTKTNGNPKWAYYFGECVDTFLNLNLENGEKTSVQQLKNAVLDNIDIAPNSNKLMSKWIHTETCKIQFFQQNNNQWNSRTYGLCKQYPKYIRCHYIIEEEGVFYKVGIYSNNLKSKNAWNEKDIIPVIEREAKKLLNSFLQK